MSPVVSVQDLYKRYRLPRRGRGVFGAIRGTFAPTYDTLDALKALAATRRPGSPDGLFNTGGYSDPQIDELITKIQIELDTEKRNELIARALTLLKDDFAYIPLHQQVVVWATDDKVDLAITGDNYFQLRFVKMK